MRAATTLRLLRADARRSARDPVVLILALLPAAVLVGYNLALPRIVVAAGVWADIVHIVSIATLLLLSPLMFGFVSGLMLLDERDEGVLVAIEVTAAGRARFVAYRLALPTLLGAALTVGILLTAGADLVPPGAVPVFVLLAAAQAPFMTLLLGAFARSKVEGLVLGKVGNVIALLGGLAVLLPMPWRLAGAVVPHFWTVELLVRPIAGTGGTLRASAALASSLVVLLLLNRIFQRRAD